jgi:hypothetical protein
MSFDTWAAEFLTDGTPHEMEQVHAALRAMIVIFLIVLALYVATL